MAAAKSCWERRDCSAAGDAAARHHILGCWMTCRWRWPVRISRGGLREDGRRRGHGTGPVRGSAVACTLYPARAMTVRAGPRRRCPAGIDAPRVLGSASTARRARYRRHIAGRHLEVGDRPCAARGPSASAGAVPGFSLLTSIGACGRPPLRRGARERRGLVRGHRQGSLPRRAARPLPRIGGRARHAGRFTHEGEPPPSSRGPSEGLTPLRTGPSSACRGRARPAEGDLPSMGMGLGRRPGARAWPADHPPCGLLTPSRRSGDRCRHHRRSAGNRGQLRAGDRVRFVPALLEKHGPRWSVGGPPG